MWPGMACGPGLNVALKMPNAALWVVSVGCQAEAALPTPMLDELPDTHIARRRARGRRAPRVISCFRRGRLLVIAALLNGQAIPQGQLLPEPWPKSLDTHMERPSAYRPLQKAA